MEILVLLILAAVVMKSAADLPEKAFTSRNNQNARRGRAPAPDPAGGEWDGTALAFPERRWVKELTGEEVRGGKDAVADLLRRFPVALLSRADG